MAAVLRRGGIMMIDSILCHLLAGSAFSGRYTIVMVPNLGRARLLGEGPSWLGLSYRSALVGVMRTDRLWSS